MYGCEMAESSSGRVRIVRESEAGVGMTRRVRG